MTELSPLAKRLLIFLQLAGGRVMWQTIQEQGRKAKKDPVELPRDKIVALAAEIRSHGYPIHETKNHEFYLGESEMFEGQIDPKTKKMIGEFVSEFDASLMR